MNFNELDKTLADSDSDPDRAVHEDSQHHRTQPISQEALSLPSAPLDPEWVSPFTLPPLPALRKTRGQSKLLRSPEERLHQRSSSSAYYAAAWGSPYATPSPSKSPNTQHIRRRSQEPDTTSPLALRTREFTPESTRVAGITRTQEPGPSSSIKRRANSWDKSTTLSERFNWLSESELSGGEEGTNSTRTPTKETYLKSLKASANNTKTTRSYSHQVQDSVATITPNTFNADSVEEEAQQDKAANPPATMELPAGTELEPHQLNNGLEKPLPSLPHSSPTANKIEQAASAAMPDSPSRPSVVSIQSFQRPKRKVPWKGKSCIIALPSIDRESAGLPPLLSSDEIKARLQKWAAEGYDTDKLSIQGPQDASSSFGQSKALFPDPLDMYIERKQSQLHVHIPDQADWDAWVDYLKEEKLRALGVTPSNSEPPMSVHSPFSSTMSRVSSAYPSLVASPPLSTMSANGNPVRIASNTFSPPLGHQGNTTPHTGSHIASPSISGYFAPLHGHKQSIAHPRMTSPYDYPVTHPGSFSAGIRNSNGAYGTRQFSPPTAFNLQSLGQVLTPMVPVIPSHNHSRGMSQHPTMEQIRQQQQRQQQLHQHMRQYSYIPPPQSRSADQLPRTPMLESPNRKTPEIMHPTPRSHRHNLSAALQKGVDDEEARRADNVPNVPEHKIPKSPEAEQNEEAQTSKEEDQESELPVLKRPETMPDDDNRSEIETNPSIAASPLLMNDESPFGPSFTSLRQIKDVLQYQSQHKPALSMSKLNVKAPEFNPQSRFSSTNFSFGGQSFQPSTEFSSKAVDATRPPFTTKNLSISGLNVEAPSFTPSFKTQSTPGESSVLSADTPAKQSIATPSRSTFTFSSPSFNVDAPEFKPGQSFSFTAGTQSPLTSNPPLFTSAGNIFGNVTVDANSRVNRRGVKVLPIVQPRSNENTDNEEEVDDEGRIGAPSDRQKRARRIGGEEEEELQFASSAPFNTKDGLANQKDNNVVQAQETDTELPKSAEKVVEHEQSDILSDIEQEKEEGLETETALVEDVSSEATQNARTLSRNLEPEISTVENETEVFEDRDEHQRNTKIVSETMASDFEIENAPIHTTIDNESDPNIQVNEKVEEESLVQQTDAEPDTKAEEQPQPVTTASSVSHEAKSSLSALAKPFEFRPNLASSFVSRSKSPAQASITPKKTQGLMASRFATISPPLEKLSGIDSADSPLPELYEYVRPEDVSIDVSERSYNHSGKATPAIESSNKGLEATPDLVRSIENQMQSKSAAAVSSRTPSQSSRIEESMPSYEEIDAVMKQFENNPDLGVERDDSPVKSTPTIAMRLAPIFRSDAPSPSPKRVAQSPLRRADWGLGIHRLNEGNEEVSDWNNEFSPRQIDKLQNQARRFDSRLNSLVDGMLEHRLGPLEQALHTIQQSIMSLIDNRSHVSSQRNPSNGTRADSDADDEDEVETLDRLSSYRSRSPSRNQRKAEKLRAMVIDTMTTQNLQVSERSVPDMSGLHSSLDEIKQLTLQRQQGSAQAQPDIRALMEDVISNHAHFKGLPKQADYEALQTTTKLKIDILESSLKDAEKRIDTEIVLRQRADDDIKELNRKLVEAQEQATKYREASEQAQSKIIMLRKDQEVHEELRLQHADVLQNNRALEDTLAEYRVTSNQFRDDIKLERARNEDLIRRLRNLREDFNEKLESRQTLQTQLARLQDRMTQVMDDVHAEEAEWRSKDQERVVQNKTIQAALDHEIRHRQKLEVEIESLLADRKDGIRVKALYEHTQQEASDLRKQIVVLTDEKKSLADRTFTIERELAYAKESASGDLLQATARLQSELEAAQGTIESLQTDSDAQISRLQKRLDDAELDLEDQKAKHDIHVSETAESNAQALHEANQKREIALQELHSSHERKLNDLRERHTRALHNSSDDRHRLEYNLNEKLAISEDRTKHMEGQIKDLEERLEITKSAARAAVEAATSKTANILTPASSVMASPPQRVSSASVQIAKGTGLPEKISPQAMRESILVLQEQLQNREQMIEQLETELAAIDKDAPLKVRERDNEIALLRELLGVRVDDLSEIITTLSQSSFDREATKNAAIRLKTNLQMEQQLRERAASLGGITNSLPSLTTISNLAPSPRGLPLAAAAAWGNWRKARDFSLNAVSDIAANISQTPSKSTTGSPSGLLAGIITPPSAYQRTPSPSEGNSASPPSARPLAAAAAAAARKNTGGASEARPLRPFSTQARTLSSRQAEKRRGSADSTSPTSESSRQQSKPWPETPTTSRNFKSLDLGDDIDEDASPLDTHHPKHSETDDVPEPVAAM